MPQFARHAALLALLLFAGCWGGKTPGIDITEGDPEINRARANARATVSQFISALQRPAPGQTLFAVKAKFTDGENVEYMWLTDLRYEQGKFVGVINNDPGVVGNVSMGDTHTIGAYEIEDWMIVQNEQRVGGYSVDVVARRQGTVER